MGLRVVAYLPPRSEFLLDVGRAVGACVREGAAVDLVGSLVRVGEGVVPLATGEAVLPASPVVGRDVTGLFVAVVVVPLIVGAGVAWSLVVGLAV